MSLTETWTRNSFDVTAVRITEANIYEVAIWCSGRVYRSPTDGRKQYVYFSETRYNRIKECKAYVGDWIILSDEEFKHYRDRSFRQAYTPKTNRYDEVLALVEVAMGGHGWIRDAFNDELRAEDVAREIVKLFGEE